MMENRTEREESEVCGPVNGERRRCKNCSGFEELG